MEARPSPISEAELDVLKTLWDLGPSTVRAVNTALRRGDRRWAYTTVLTLLQRLEAKGYTRSDKTRPAHVFARPCRANNCWAVSSATWPTDCATARRRRCCWPWWKTAG